MQFRFNWIVSVGNWLSYCLFWGSNELTGKQFNKLILNVLNEFKFSWAVSAHHENSQETIRLFDAWISHFNKNISVFLEVYHELLLFLQMLKAVLIYSMCIMEKEIIFRCQLYSNIFNLILSLATLNQIRYCCLLTSLRTLTRIASRVPTSCGPDFGSFMRNSKGVSRSNNTWWPSAI